MAPHTARCRWADLRFALSQSLVRRARSRHHLPVTEDNQGWTDALARIGTDWWATIVAGVIALLAVFDVLPKIPW
jgi:hypothetical protein